MLLEGGTSHQGSTSSSILSLRSISVNKLVVFICTLKIMEMTYEVGWVNNVLFDSDFKVKPNNWLFYGPNGIVYVLILAMSVNSIGMSLNRFFIRIPNVGMADGWSALQTMYPYMNLCMIYHQQFNDYWIIIACICVIIRLIMIFVLYNWINEMMVF